MTTINVQFSDATETTIVSYFAGPQDPAVFPNQGTVSQDDARYKTFFDGVYPEFQNGLPAPSA